MTIRQPIISMLGHVDHGKTSLLDLIRQTTLQEKEAGGITQSICATEIPIKVIKDLCGNLLKKFRFNLKIPGLLFVDTPGHKAFTNLRKRGGNLADIAVLVVDVSEGFKPQTIEAVEILRASKRPFMVAANKIDLISSWKNTKKKSFLEAIKEQNEYVQKEIDNRVYQILGSLAELGFESDRFDRVEDFKKTVSIIPVSATTGEGIAELLTLLSGLSQKYLEGRLDVDTKGCAKGVVLEVKEEKGLGKTLDVVVYDGRLDEGDMIVIGGLEGPVITKIRSLLKPAPLMATREKGCKFSRVKSVTAAAGIKISCSNLETVVAGMPIAEATPELIEEVKKTIEKEVKSVLVSTDKSGIIIKTDTLGSAEAIINLSKSQEIPVRKAGIGNITKNDVMEALNSKQENKFHAAIFGFDVNTNKDAEQLAQKHGIKIILNNIIYKLLDDYLEWKDEVIESEKKKELENIVYPAQARLLPGYVFRQKNPAVAGFEIITGKIKPGYRLMTEDGTKLGEVKGIQKESKNVELAEKGEKIALSISKAIIGKNLQEGDTLITDMPKKDFLLIKSKLKQFLPEEDVETVKKILSIKRKKDPMWGM